MKIGKYLVKINIENSSATLSRAELVYMIQFTHDAQSSNHVSFFETINLNAYGSTHVCLPIDLIEQQLDLGELADAICQQIEDECSHETEENNSCTNCGLITRDVDLEIDDYKERSIGR